jgi:hypothetical protein
MLIEKSERGEERKNEKQNIKRIVNTKIKLCN